MIANTTISLTLKTDGRLDKALASCDLPEGAGLSRARLQQLIKEGHVQLNGRTVSDTNHAAKAGDVYVLTLPPPRTAQPRAEEIELDIIFEDKDLLVVNKQPGLVVHPAAGNWEHTLVNALLGHCGKSLSGIGGVARPGIVHRLDKDTSGLMVVAKNDMAHQGLSAQFADRTLSRLYQALVWGVPSPIKGEIVGAIGRHPKARQKMAVVKSGGKEAQTFYETQEVFDTLAALVSCKLATGRTHQIRVHLAHIGHPVIGDPVYGHRRRHAGGKGPGVVDLLEAFPRQALHAGQLSFIHPRTGKKMVFKAPMPADMAALARKLKKKPLA